MYRIGALAEHLPGRHDQKTHGYHGIGILSAEKVPAPGESYTAKVFRGVRKQGGAVDPGDYGKGQYWAPRLRTAAGYALERKGRVLTAQVTLRNPYIERGHSLDELTRPQRLAAKKRGDSLAKLDIIHARVARQTLLKRGHDGVLVVAQSYGRPAKVVELVVFKPSRSVRGISPWRTQLKRE